MEVVGFVVVYEEVLGCDLVDCVVVDVMVVGCEVIIYFGGVLVECFFEEILEVNIKGVFYIYEVVCWYGVKCVIFVSFNYVIGFYGQDECIDVYDMKCFDGYYGLFKFYGEDMVQFYFDCYGVEMVSICIGLIFLEVINCCMLVSWMSMDDFE